MPTLSNAKHELYCAARASGLKPAQAAQAAGYQPGSAVTVGLERTKEIIERIDELTEQKRHQKEQQLIAAREQSKIVGQMSGLSKAWVLQQLADNVVKARHEGAFKESNEALKLIGAELDMFNGGSSVKSEGQHAMQVMDLDALAVLTEEAHQTLIPAAEPKEMDLPLALSLIEGAPKRPKPDRSLTIGSETDVALKLEDEDAEDQPE
jgi:hypothetical protein